MKHLSRSINLFVLLFGAFALLGCSKYSSPNKVKRIITEGTWKVAYLYINGSDLTSDYNPYAFNFQEDNNIIVVGDPTIDGTWTTDVNKNPTTLELQLTPFVPFNRLNADWTITLLKNDRLEAEVQTDSGKDLIILTQLN